MYPASETLASRRGLFCTSLIIGVSCALNGNALAAPGAPAERAKAIVKEVEADPAARGLVGPAAQRSRDAAARAEAAAPAAVPLLEAMALEWAEVARDLLRASAAERTSDRLEQEASALETEIARLRSALEQTMARVGRARQDLEGLEQRGVSGSSSGGPAR
jgi:hypothetical protein